MSESSTSSKERLRTVKAASHSGEMEGLLVTSETREIAEAYISGEIDSDELVAQVQSRYRNG